MERVMYLLGAGFSAPLGIPVMNNFLIKSKDMYFQNSDKYGYFEEVFKTITEMSVSKNYYESDLFNIEEILSILEMNDYLEGNSLKSFFLKYISDVIQYYTPSLEPLGNISANKLPVNWYNFIFGKDKLWNLFGYFVGSLQSLVFGENRSQDFGRSIRKTWTNRDLNSRTHYSVITLNYDLVFETICEFVSTNYQCQNAIAFSMNEKHESNEGIHTPILAKLHGTINGAIVPPTWNKGTNGTILESWKLAYKSLVNTNHLRIIGYSLPIADAYVKYLLKSAVIQAPHLKRIDVLCLDPDGSVKRRYDDFITFKYYKFKNASVTDYFNLNYEKHKREIQDQKSQLQLDKLEEVHQNFFESK